jgi:hypothetical protein
MTARPSTYADGRTLPLLGLLAGTAALANWHVATVAIDIAPIPPAAGVLADVGAGPSLIAARSIPALAAMPETAARPLISPTRRQPSARPLGVSPLAALEAAPDGLVLVGILRSGGGTRRALFRTSDAPRGTWVEEGDAIRGWRLIAVRERQVVLEQDGRRHELALRRATDRQAATSRPR